MKKAGYWPAFSHARNDDSSGAVRHHGIISVTWPGLVTVITPPHVHWQVQVLSSAGMKPSKTVGAPGFQGVVTGMQGIGVNTPDAAAVAEATVGLLGVVHMPNGMMFFMGTKSMMFAAGWLPDSTRFSGVTTKVDGATPKGHVRMAPLTTWTGMSAPFPARTQPPVAWISTRRFSPASGSSAFSSWLSPLPTARRREAATPLSIR